MGARSVAAVAPQLAADRLGFVRWGRIAGKVLVTTDGGDWAFLGDAEFEQLLAGAIADGHPRFHELQAKGLLRDGLNLDAMAERLSRRIRPLMRGPHVHVLVLTRRCGERCLHCQTASGTADRAGSDMSASTAEQVVELALQSPAPALTFEFQGGEPLLNFEVLRHVVEFARARAEVAGKTLSFNLLSNCTAMTEERAEWLIANDVRLCTSLDGPAGVHDANRRWKHGGAHADVVRWIDYFNRRYRELGRDPRQWHVDALLTTTRAGLAAWREVVDEYVARGLPAIHLRPLNPAEWTPETWEAIGYTAEEYLRAYRQALDYILVLNRQGVDLVERTASIFLAKILGAEDSGFVDVQSPCGAGTGQVVYNHDGGVFPCDEARLVDALGDPLFALGQVSELTMAQVMRHPAVRAIAAASLLDAQPMCAECWNKPFCAVSPVLNFVTQQSLFGQRPCSFKCKEHMSVSGRMFELLADDGDVETAAILKRWAATPPSAGDWRNLKEAP